MIVTNGLLLAPVFVSTPLVATNQVAEKADVAGKRSSGMAMKNLNDISNYDRTNSNMDKPFYNQMRNAPLFPRSGQRRPRNCPGYQLAPSPVQCRRHRIHARLTPINFRRRLHPALTFAGKIDPAISKRLAQEIRPPHQRNGHKNEEEVRITR